MDIGPVRLVAVDEACRRVVRWAEGHDPKQWPVEPTAWLLMTARPCTDGKHRYVFVPFPCPEDWTPPILRSTLENGWRSLEYLIEHPEIDAL